MAVFTAYKLEDVLSLPVSVLPPLVLIAEDERRDFSYHIATAIISAQSEKGFNNLSESRTQVLVDDPNHFKGLRSKDNMDRARQIAELLKRGDL